MPFFTAFFESINVSVVLKSMICLTKGRLDSICFRTDYEKAEPKTKEFWKWIMLQSMRNVSEGWDSRLKVGRMAGVEKKFFDTATVSDFGFVYLTMDYLTEMYDVWGCVKQHHEWLEDIKRVKKEGNSVGEIVDSAKNEAVTAKTKFELKFLPGKGLIRYNPETGKVRPGRKPGEEGLGSQRFVCIYNDYVLNVRDYVMEHQKEVKTWVDKTWEWVNQERFEVDDSDDEDETDGKTYAKRRVKPVVPGTMDLDF